MVNNIKENHLKTFRGMAGTHLLQATMSKLFCLNSVKSSILKEKILFLVIANSFLLQLSLFQGRGMQESNRTSRKHAYIILTPLKPHFHIVNLGFTLF